jgi:hypothetical protein
MTVRSAVKLSCVVQVFDCITNFILVKNPMTVRSAEKLFGCGSNSLSMRGSTLGRSPMTVRSAGRPSVVAII